MSTKTSKMRVGQEWVVNSGEFAGSRAVIVDPKPFPDSDERRRKITIDVVLEDGTVERVYMLPRLLDNPHAVPVASVPLSGSGPVVVQSPSMGPILVPGEITDPMDPRLDPWRPDPAIVRDYISRTLPNGEKDVEFLLRFHEQRENVLLVGDTQSGKTMLVQVLAVAAAKRDGLPKPYPVFTLSGSSGVTDFDLFGQPTAFTDEHGQERLVNLPGVVDLATRAGGVLYLDEVNMMSERVTSSLHPLCDHRRAFVNRQKAVRFVHEGEEVFMPEVVHAHPDLFIIATTNPASYRGTGAMNEAFVNRWTHVQWGYDESTEKKLIPSAAVRLLGQALREARAQRALTTPVGTASLMRLAKHVDEVGVETALWMFQAMFLPQEQPKVATIITDRSISLLLNDEQAAKAQSEIPEAQVSNTEPVSQSEYF